MAGMSEVKNEVGMSAEVTRNELVVVYDSNNNELFVRPEVAQDLLSQGYRNAPLDVRATLSDFVSFADAAVEAVEEFVNGVISDNNIDTSDVSAQATATFAMSKLFQIYKQLISDIYKTYPVVQGEGVKMLNEDGKETEVDGNQLDDYLAKGYTKI